MSSVPKLIPGAKRIAAATAHESHVRGKPGDAFQALLDKAGATIAPRPPTHAAVAHVSFRIPGDSAQVRPQNEPLTLPTGTPHDSAGKDGEAVGSAGKPTGDGLEDEVDQNAAIPIATELPPVAAGPPPPVAIDIDPLPPVPDDSRVERDQAERRDRDTSLFAKTHAQLVPRAEAHAVAPQQSRTAPRMQPASADTVPAPAPQPNEAPVRKAQAPAATGSAAQTEKAAALVPGVTVVRYRTYAPADQQRPGRSAGADQIARSTATDSIQESEPPDEAPRRMERRTPDSPRATIARPDPHPPDAVVSNDPPLPGNPGGAPLGLPAATVATISATVTEAARTLSAETAADTDPVARTPDAAAPARHVEIAIDLQDYGLVNVRLTLVGEALTLRMSAGHAATARRLEHERDALGSILSRAGYDADVRPVDRTPPPAASSDGFAQADGGALFSDPGSRGAEPGRQRTRSPGFPEQSDVDETGPAGARRVGALYV